MANHLRTQARRMGFSGLALVAIGTFWQTQAVADNCSVLHDLFGKPTWMEPTILTATSHFIERHNASAKEKDELAASEVRIVKVKCSKKAAEIEHVLVEKKADGNEIKYIVKDVIDFKAKSYERALYDLTWRGDLIPMDHPKPTATSYLFHDGGFELTIAYDGEGSTGDNVYRTRQSETHYFKKNEDGLTVHLAAQHSEIFRSDGERVSSVTLPANRVLHESMP